jgi:hypothetical protein
MRRRTLIAAGGIAATGLGAWRFWPVRTPTKVMRATMSDVEFEAIRTAVKPTPGEDLFADIPWQTSLWEARKLAAKEGKPILLWEMDGHPLGCG